VAGNKDKKQNDPKGCGAIEYTYHLVARAAGITMSECRLLEENGRRHFMTRRFDRLAGGQKLHTQSLCTQAHFDYNYGGAYASEQALLTVRQLKLPLPAVEEQFRRMAFNVTYHYNPSSSRAATHQMTLNGKRDGFTLADFAACAKAALMKRGRAATITEEVQAAVACRPEFAAQAKIADEWRDKLQNTHRLPLS